MTKVNIKGTNIVGKFAMGFAMFVLTPFLVTTVSGRREGPSLSFSVYDFITHMHTSRVVQVFRRSCFGTRVGLIVLGRARI